MKKGLLLLVVGVCLLLIGCSYEANEITDVETIDNLLKEKEEGKYNKFIAYDLRPQSQCESGHIKGFLCIDTGNLSKSPQEQAIHNITNKYSEYKKNDIILLICEDGSISKDTADKLSDLGYKKVYYFSSGYEGYTQLKGDNFIPEVGCGC